jgi:hypothetical protein
VSRGCGHRKAYRTVADANAGLVDLAANGIPVTDLNIATCAHCGYWHIVVRPDPNPPPRRKPRRR